jgi:hypothetical protein
LRNVYQKTSLNKTPGAESIGGFGMAHDGVEASVISFLHRPAFQPDSEGPAVPPDLEAFILSFDTGMAPAVGYSVTVAATNVSSGTISSVWALLESQTRLKVQNITNIDLIVKGTLDGVRHGLLFRPSTSDYRVDTTNMPSMTRAQLVAKVQAGDRLTLMGVPAGSGTRMGLDRNLNGILDFDEPRPTLMVAQAGSFVVLSWPYEAVGYILESASSASTAEWNPVAEPVEIIGSKNVVTNSMGSFSRFYRLHSW